MDSARHIETDLLDSLFELNEATAAAEEILEVLNDCVNNPVYFPDEATWSCTYGASPDEAVSMLMSENRLLREWMREQDEAVEAARRYRRAEVAHRRNPSLTSAREQVSAQVSLDRALARII